MPVLRQNVEKFDFQHVPRLRPFDVDRSGERVDQAALKMCKVCFGGVGPKLAIDAIPGVEHHLFPLADLKERGISG